MVEETASSSFGFQLIAQSKFLESVLYYIIDQYGVVAQLVERLLCKQDVAGSNPAGSTISTL